MNNTKKITDRFFKDKDGNVVLGQAPNALIIAWVLLLFANFALHDKHIGMLQSAVLFTWAYLELTQGVNGFRKTLGGIVMVGVVAGFFLR